MCGILGFIGRAWARSAAAGAMRLPPGGPNSAIKKLLVVEHCTDGMDSRRSALALAAAPSWYDAGYAAARRWLESSFCLLPVLVFKGRRSTRPLVQQRSFYYAETRLDHRSLSGFVRLADSQSKFRGHRVTDWNVAYGLQTCTGVHLAINLLANYFRLRCRCRLQPTCL